MNPLLAAVVIVICMKRQESGKIPEIEEIEAVACAVQNLHLTASAAGLATQWSSPSFLYTGALDSFLQLGEQDKCLADHDPAAETNRPKARIRCTSQQKCNPTNVRNSAGEDHGDAMALHPLTTESHSS